MSSSGIRDNYTRGKAGEYIAGQLTSNTELSIVSAYFTIQAYAALKGKLDQIKHLRFLFGEPKFINASGRDEKTSKEFGLTEQGLEIKNQLSQRKFAKDCAEWIKQKVDIRSVKQTRFLHGKIYHISDGEKAHALIGSSNFTVSGLGLCQNENRNNVELNLVANDDRDRIDLLAWFNERWEDDNLTEDVREDVLKELKRLYSNQAPDFIYYLTLFHIFRDSIDNETGTEDNLDKVKLPDTQIWKKLYEFQEHGATTAINNIQSLNGCILADSVGLGKTFTALAVIKYFELKNERVLVLCPKKLRRNWTFYKENNEKNTLKDDWFRYDVLSHTDLSRERGEVGDINLASLNWGNYDLVVIDESHNFRNNNKASQPQTREEQPRRTRYEKLINEVISNGIKTKVLLLSATPVNNELSDLRNQISLIAGGDVTDDSSADGKFCDKLGIQSVKETTRKAQEQFTNWAKELPETRKRQDLIKRIGGDFFKLLDGLSIARSRKQIQEYYKHEMNRIGSFPHRSKPRSVHSKIDLKEAFWSFEQLDEKIDNLTLALYNPTGYLLDNLPAEIQKYYERKILGGFTQQGRERILIGMMKVNLLKRLESSVDSFCLTLGRTIKKIDELEEKFSKFEKHREDNPVDYDELLPEELDDDDLENSDFAVGGKQKFRLDHIDIPKWRQALSDDRGELQALFDQTKAITPERDAKLAELRNEIIKKLKEPTITKDGRKNRKTLIFTVFADTADYLYKKLKDSIQNQNAHVALVRGDGGNKTTLGRTDYDDILTNFSPISKDRKKPSCFPQKEEEIDVLIATDCISEGQNLQDCDQLINYDIHWNPVRIIQRFGRIDRIGSLNKDVHLINFWPVEDLDRYIRVRHRVEARMALVDLSATQSENLLKDKQIEELIPKDLQFRNQQLVRMKDEILDLEDFDEHVTLSDFSLNDFRLDLLQFLKSRRKELEAAKPGLYAVVPPVAENPVAGPGVIFCLRHRGRDEMMTSGEAGPPEHHPSSGDEAKDFNPLGRYYLIYILDDGTVRLGFAQPKQALNLFRALAAGHASVFEDLCDLFDKNTRDGANMKRYDELVKKAIESIKRTFKERALGNLFAGRDGKLPSESPSSQEDEYELVTWLVVLKKPS